MKLRKLSFFLLLAFTSISASANAQFYKIHNADVAVGAMGPFTTTLTSSGTASNTQKTTDTTGVLVTMREHPLAWAGVEVNYSYAKLSERYNYINGGKAAASSVPTYMQEATGAYLFHPHLLHLQPFLAVGGGAINFDPASGPGVYQWRGAGLVELGFDIPTMNPHMGFRVQGRSLIYRAPNFDTPLISTKSWVATDEPSASVYYRF